MMETVFLYAVLLVCLVSTMLHRFPARELLVRGYDGVALFPRLCISAAVSRDGGGSCRHCAGAGRTIVACIADWEKGRSGLTRPSLSPFWLPIGLSLSRRIRTIAKWRPRQDGVRRA